MAETAGRVFSQAVKIWLKRWIALIHHFGASRELPEACDARIHLGSVEKTINKICNFFEIPRTFAHGNQFSKLF